MIVFRNAKYIDLQPNFWKAQKADMLRTIENLIYEGRNREAAAIDKRLPQINEQLRGLGV